MSTVISVENLSKAYRLGQIGTGTFSRDLKLWWARLRGKPNPLLQDRAGRPRQPRWARTVGAARCQLHGGAGRGAGHHRAQRRRQEHPAQDPLARHRPHRGQDQSQGAHRQPAGGGHRLSPRADRAREHLPERRHPGHEQAARSQRKFDEIVDFSEVEKFIDTPVKRYSSGMYVRLAFAVAAHLEPEILVVDEVLAVGDAEFQKKCLGKMGEVAGEGRTVLFVSHNMAAVNQLCPHCLLLKNGELHKTGKSPEVINSYLSFLNDNEGYIDTHDLQNRTGTGEGRINGIEFTNSYGVLATVFGINEPFNIRLHINIYKDIGNLVIGADIKNSLGYQIIHLRSDGQGRSFGPFKQNDEIIGDIRIPGLPLYPGKYIIEPWFCQKYGERIDNIQGNLSINIDQKGYMDSEKMIIPGRAILLIDCTWNASCVDNKGR